MTTDYTYGDGKYNDAANFGLFKQNWGMLRVCASRYGFAGQSEGEWNNGALLKYALSIFFFLFSLSLRINKGRNAKVKGHS
jgi:hypothetical protein